MKWAATDTNKNIREQVRHVFGSVDDKHLSLAGGYLLMLTERLAIAERSVVRGLLAFLTLWLFAYLASKGFVREGSFAGVKLEKITPLLILAPMILGYLSYALSSAVTTMNILHETVREIYDTFFPKMVTTDLDTFFMGHTFIGAEMMTFARKVSWLEDFLSKVVEALTAVLAVVGSATAIIHTTYIAILVTELPMYLVGISAGLGGILWLRGISMMAHR